MTEFWKSKRNKGLLMIIILNTKKYVQVGNSVHIKKFRRIKSYIWEALLKELVLFQVKFSFSTGEVIRRHQDQIRIRTDPVPTSQVDNENQDTSPLETPFISMQ